MNRSNEQLKGALAIAKEVLSTLGGKQVAQADRFNGMSRSSYWEMRDGRTIRLSDHINFRATNISLIIAKDTTREDITRELDKLGYRIINEQQKRAFVLANKILSSFGGRRIDKYYSGNSLWKMRNGRIVFLADKRDARIDTPTLVVSGHSTQKTIVEELKKLGVTNADI